jgi:3-hydroxyisobutyrate dehydrogenase-like beta-hydroxyacid dehydrogenase
MCRFYVEHFIKDLGIALAEAKRYVYSRHNTFQPLANGLLLLLAGCGYHCPALH